jgi:hypothetical protein
VTIEIIEGVDVAELEEPCAYGSLYDVQRWVEDVRNDRRFQHTVLTAIDSSGRPLGVLPYLLCRQGRLPGALARVRESFPAARDGRDLAVIGGLARLRGGVAVSKRSDAFQLDEIAARLFERAVKRDGATVIAPYLPAEQLGAAAAVTVVKVADGDLWSKLELCRLRDDGPRTERKSRQILRADRRKLAQHGIEVRLQPVTPELIAEAAPLVAAVSARNGEVGHPSLSQLELSRWHKFDPSSCIAFTVRNSEQDVLAVSFARRRKHLLDVQDCGMVNNHPHRALMYAGVMFIGPLDYANDQKLDVVEVGCGHPFPKQLRGATQTRLWHTLLGGSH